ncbi:MAG: hypothetical protein ABIP94_03035, partial [Planctomycetota bacterium]
MSSKEVEPLEDDCQWFKVSSGPARPMVLEGASGQAIALPVDTVFESQLPRWKGAAPGALLAHACAWSTVVLVDDLHRTWSGTDWQRVLIVAAGLRHVVDVAGRDREHERSKRYSEAKGHRPWRGDARLLAPATDWDVFDEVGSAVCPLPGAEPHDVWTKGRCVGDLQPSAHHAVRAVAKDVWHVVSEALHEGSLLWVNEHANDAVERCGSGGPARLQAAQGVLRMLLEGGRPEIAQPRSSYWPADYWPAWRGIRSWLRTEMARTDRVVSA